MNKIDNIYFSATIKLFEKNYFSRGEEKKKKEKKNKAENTYILCSRENRFSGYVRYVCLTKNSVQ